MSIRVLPPDVAARIAAGEVIERPASVVKELVENALDAGATRIAVELVGGGLESIQVSDDGCGIQREEMEVAFARHATSKLDDSEDLSRILTLGFRGEALPSVAAVAEVEVISRPSGAEGAAYLRLLPETPSQTGTRSGPPGTSITVRRLFARQPARRKFLRSPTSEAGAAAAVVTHYALAYPHVRFSLSLDRRQTLRTTGSGDLRDAVMAVYGADVAGVLLPVDHREGDLAARGLVSPPDVSRSNRGYISLFVNRRWVQNRRLVYAIESAYEGLLMTGRRPIAVLDIKAPYEEVDVNVHPAKAEVRFRDESAAFSLLQKAVRAALLEMAPVAAAAPSPFRLQTQPVTAPLWRHALDVELRQPREQARGQPEDGRATPAQTLPVLRVIGQFGNIYIIAEGPGGMYLIDQHAAHERVLYERFCQLRAERRPEVQGLLQAVTVEVPPRQLSLVGQEAEALSEHGFQIEPFGENAYLLRSLPVSLSSTDAARSFLEFLDVMLEEEAGDRRDRVAMALACHNAVRAGKTLALEEMRELIRQLEESEAPNTCPHGRPTMVHMSAELLAREFGRR